MKFTKTTLVDAEEYKTGMEDGIDDAVPFKVIDGHKQYGCLDGEEDGIEFNVPYIRTREGKMYIRTFPPDWIVKDNKGNTYPCHAEIFAEMYEKAKHDE